MIGPLICLCVSLFQTLEGLVAFMKEALGPKDVQVWKPRLTRDAVKFSAKDPAPSQTNPQVKSVNEGHSILYLDGDKLTVQAACHAVSRFLRGLTTR